MTLPSTNAAGLVYDFYDAERRIAYLGVDHMTNYREGCEQGNSSPELCASTPSATETFTDLVVDMRAAGSETLIVDLRHNEGGNSAMADILIYFVFGKDTLLPGRYSVRPSANCFGVQTLWHLKHTAIAGASRQHTIQFIRHSSQRVGR